MLQITAAIQLKFFGGKEKAYMLCYFEFENVNSSLMRKLPQHLQSIFITDMKALYKQTKKVEMNMYLYYIITQS